MSNKVVLVLKVKFNNEFYTVYNLKNYFNYNLKTQMFNIKNKHVLQIIYTAKNIETRPKITND